MKVVSIGDLVIDYYYKNGELLGVNGGMTSHNIIANLAKMGIKTGVYGVCGNDIMGNIAIKSLSDIGVDIENVDILDDINTRCFHVSYIDDGKNLTFTSKKRCPICNNKKWYDDSRINADKVLDKIDKEDLLIFDNLNEINQEIIDKSYNRKVIDLGQYFEFENLSNEEIVNKIKNKFEIVNFNERVWKYLLDRFAVKDDIQLYDLFDIKLITITMGKKGARFIFDREVIDFKLEQAVNEVDSTGAGDAFFASLIKDFVNNNLEISLELLPIWYENSVKLTCKVVKKMGARGHINSLYKIKRKNDICTCYSFNIISRKQIKRCNININNLKIRVINAMNSRAYDGIKKIDFKTAENYLFVGTGGSFAGAIFASKVINEMYGSNTYAMLPRDVVYRNNKLIDKVIMFSYSGTTSDLIEGTKGFSMDKKYIITKGEVQKIVLKTGISKNNIISYRTGTNKGKERGFLSFEGAVAPASLYLKYYLEDDNNIDVCQFVGDTMDYWDNYFKEKFKNNIIKEMIKKGNTINIFTGDYTTSATIDIESKIIESGILNCIVHEKKNFSHGRFINYENLDNRNNIYFKQYQMEQYEEKLLDYISGDNNLIVESRYNGILCEFDLLVASQYLIYYIGKILDIDVSKPDYSEDAMKIYFYKGQL